MKRISEKMGKDIIGDDKCIKVKNLICIMCIIFTMALNIIIANSVLVWINEFIPIIINVLLIILIYSYVIKNKKSVLRWLYIGVIIISLITSALNLIHCLEQIVIFETQRTFYSSPNQTNTIIVEKIQLLGEKNINIYEVKYIFFKTEIATQLLGNYVQVKWINDYKVNVTIDNCVNTFDFQH